MRKRTDTVLGAYVSNMPDFYDEIQKTYIRHLVGGGG
jgi:hypothetical protein